MRGSSLLNAGLWFVQALLALFFALASGAPKFFAPQEVLNMPIVLPREFLMFVGTCEIVGGLGLVLPGLLRTRTELTSVAAGMLALLTVCAATYQLLAAQPASAVFAASVGLVCALVWYARWRVAPLAGTAPRGAAPRGAAPVPA